ncbi:hypothetical protein AB0C07_12065 [Actinoplanes missouriensis]|uniref:hypothetical protein n=1 Tax=Actinoplanes missouriensis TaxID=1866 RepID=UPI0033E36D7B
MIAAVVAAMLNVGSPATASLAQTGYRIVDLGTLGGEQSRAVAVNNRGHVVGESQTPDGSWHGFLWRHGTMTDLGALLPTGVNNRDEIIGTFDYATTAYLWRDGKLIDLGNLGGPLNFPVAINDRGQVTGMSSTADNADVPFLWTAGRMRAVPLTWVSGINNRTEISGGVFESDSGHAAVYRRGTVTALGAGPQDRSSTRAINEAGWVAGWRWPAGGDRVRAALWRHGVVTDLGTLGGDYSESLAVNNRGEVLGVSNNAPASPERPFLWRAGVMTDLSEYGVAAATGINDSGEICGTMGLHAALYRPI